MIIAWCDGQQSDIVQVNNKQDYEDCTNLPTTVLKATEVGAVDGIIAANTENDVGSLYFASRSRCKDGLKVEIEIFESGVQKVVDPASLARRNYLAKSLSGRKF